jgi:23S rRNA pseudouridine955/2504/2580 synthase
MSQVHYLIIDTERAGQRIDNFLLAYLKNVPRTLIYRILRKGEVRVNKGRVQPTYRLKEGDSVRIPPVKMETSELPVKVKPDLAKVLEGSVLYEDDGLLVINKPSGLAVHGGSGVSCGVIEALRVIRPEAKFLELVHRLDRETSGCLMIAKKRSVLTALHADLRNKDVKKVYHALVIGRWPKHVHKIDAPLEKNVLKSGERVVRSDDEGKASVTTFGVVKYLKELTLIEAHPHTGRTHQIRVHSQLAGHPIVGDDKYADRKRNKELCEQYGIKRLCLHALRLSFILPGTEQKITVEAPYDQAFTGILQRVEHG